jgi:hypothetical protein
MAVRYVDSLLIHKDDRVAGEDLLVFSSNSKDSLPSYEIHIQRDSLIESFMGFSAHPSASSSISIEMLFYEESLVISILENTQVFSAVVFKIHETVKTKIFAYVRGGAEWLP